jgi:hypothetical protein
MSAPGDAYTLDRFETDLVRQINDKRRADGLSAVVLDQDLDRWLEKQMDSLALDDVNGVTKRIQEAQPRYFRVSVCTASGPTIRALVRDFHDFSQRTTPEMTHVACAVRPELAGMAQQGVLIVGQRLEDFSPEALTSSTADAFFSICPHCQHPHVVRISRQQRSLGLECPECRRTYAVVASDQNNRFRYVNEFLTGYAPPAVFARDQSRLRELFTIWSAVHENCIYTKDPGARSDQTDSWQTSLETQRAGTGDCEDSSIFLCDWLLSRGFQARVALGRYGDLGGHAWCVVNIEGQEYLLESTEGKPDPNNPPLVSRVGSRYVPEVQFDRFAIYVRAVPGQTWQGKYWSETAWARVEPRRGRPIEELLPAGIAAALRNDSSNTARTLQPNPAAAPFMKLEEIPMGSNIWQMPLGPRALKVQP